MQLPTSNLVLALALAACGTSAGSALPDGRGLTDGRGDGDARGAVDARSPADGARPDGAAAAADPGADGPYDVLTRDLDAAGTTITLYAPSHDGGASIADGSFAVVIVSPGFQMPRAQYASYAHRLATHGFLAIAQDFGGGFSPDHQALADQTNALIDWALAGGDGSLAGHTSGAVGVAGHSLGGKISFLAASSDARIGAIVGWDPVDSGTPSVTPEKMGSIVAPIVVLGETTDASGGFMPCAPAADDYAQYYAAAGSPALSITVAGADHMDFVDDPSCGLCGFCTAGTADDVAVRALTSRTTVAAFRRYLRGETDMDAYLTGTVIQADVSAGTVTIDSK